MGYSKLMLDWCEEQTRLKREKAIKLEKIKKKKMLPSLIDLGKGRISKYMNKEASVDPNTKHSLNHNKKDKTMSKKNVTAVAAATDTNVTNMKPKPGTAKPSGKVAKGGPATSPTDGRSLNVKRKGGKVKKGM